MLARSPVGLAFVRDPSYDPAPFFFALPSWELS
jgi:hypothetical protein